MIKGFCYIMLFYVLGEMMSLLIGKLIPGSVCGMILLFIALTLKWIRPHDVDKAASALTRNMALFFVPASIGLMHEYKILMSNWVVLLTVSVVTTLLVIVVVGVTEEQLDRKLSHNKGGEKI